MSTGFLDGLILVFEMIYMTDEWCWRSINDLWGCMKE